MKKQRDNKRETENSPSESSFDFFDFIESPKQEEKTSSSNPETKQNDEAANTFTNKEDQQQENFPCFTEMSI